MKNTQKVDDKPIGFIPQTLPYEGSRFAKFGMNELVDLIINRARNLGPLGWNSYEKRKELIEKTRDFFSFLETDLSTIKKKQKLFGKMLEDKKLVHFLLTKAYPRIPDIKNYRTEQIIGQYDGLALGTVEYLRTLSSLMNGVPEYNAFSKKLEKMFIANPWLKQMEELEKNSSRYSDFLIKAEVEIKFKQKTDKGGLMYSFKTKSYTVNFVAKNNSLPMFNRLEGDITLGKKTKKGVTDVYVYVRQELRTLSDDQWNELFEKIVKDGGWKKMFNLTGEESLLLNISIPITGKGTKLRATIMLGDTQPKKLVYVDRAPIPGRKNENYYVTEWVNAGEERKFSKRKINTNYLEELHAYKSEHILVGSRSFIKSYHDEFNNLFEEIDQLLILAAVANFYNTCKGKQIFPTMRPKEKMVTKITAGVNPLFLERKPCVSNDAVFAPGANGALITGANTGGKTGYTNMIALNQMLAQAGLPVFAKQAELSVKDRILCHYVESEDIGVNRSRYQSELHRLHEIIDEVTPYSLVLFDEPFSGTSVESGTNQAHEVARVLAKVGCAFIMNTHFHGLIDLIGNNGTSSVRNYHFVLPNKENPRKTDFKVLPGGIKFSAGEAVAVSEKVNYKSMMQKLRNRKVLIAQN